MAETLGLSVRLLVVRYLVFVVVLALMMALSCSGGIKECAGHISALMRARVNAGARCVLQA